MLTFFLTIIIVYVFWLVIRPLIAGYARRKIQQRFEDMLRNTYGASASGPTSDTQRRSRNSYTQRPRRQKIFSSDEGEYVEFQEITIEDNTSSTGTRPRPASSSSDTYTPREPRITDAEWEDLP